MFDWLRDLYASFFGSDVFVAPEYLLFSLPIAWVIYRVHRRRGRASGGFWQWLIPRRIYLHRSHMLDLKLFVLGRLMVFLGLFARVSLTTAIAGAVAAQGFAPSGLSLTPLVLALVLWLVTDMTSYWMHRAYHELSLIWPLHAVHHSAEVLTPFSAYRQHPLALVLSSLVLSAVTGLAQGLVIGSAAPDTAILEIAGINAFLVLGTLAMANFHHSHIWVSFGPMLEHLLISPAQHQIHHSTRPEHFNKNYGQTLALWDWLFGTLYVIRGAEDVRFGLDGPQEERLMTHGFWATLSNPVARIWRALRPGSGK
ncbi:fatty acid hydroxylase family protein [Rhodobacteraceae bacterium 63075]|nr:fatty acid hydroxylase family protein [Rhodobacteraceae bacterium 63075]